MRIAIAALLFDDTTRIGSHRARALSAQLAKLGNEVTVFTQDFEGHPPAPDDVEVLRLGHFSEDLWPRTGFRGLLRKTLMAAIVAPTTVPVFLLARRQSKGSITAEEQGRLWELNQARLSSVKRMDQLLSTRIWLAHAEEKLLQQLSEGAPFDIVFSTFESLGRQMRDLGVARKWVDDFRDPAYSPAFLPAMRFYLRRYQDTLLADADWSTAISIGVKRSLTNSRTGRRKSAEITVVTNGFTPRRTPPAPLPERPAPLRIGYTGALYSARIGIFREFLRTVKGLDPECVSFELHYAGRDGALVSDIARSEEALPLIHDHGLLSHSSTLSLQEEMDVLMVASWNSEEEEGVLSGKFLEYLGADRPILALVAGPKPGSELGQLISEMNVGICIEEAGGAPQTLRLREWLSTSASRRARGEAISFSPNRDVIARFSYPNIALQLDRLLREVSMEPNQAEQR